ncbi:uncharacterized protein [Bemisia tabaci]|uniref:uncharacterized protein n=1 Tax=Bemisia tabaci TaxID=7038 RepID=UPI003B285D91
MCGLGTLSPLESIDKNFTEAQGRLELSHQLEMNGNECIGSSDPETSCDSVTIPYMNHFSLIQDQIPLNHDIQAAAFESVVYVYEGEPTENFSGPENTNGQEGNISLK